MRRRCDLEAQLLAPRHRPHAYSALLLAVTLLGSTGIAIPARANAAGSETGFRTLSGRAARALRLPTDVQLVNSIRLSALNLTVERYQQYATSFEAAVDGGQLTVVSRAGEPVLVVGAHYPTTTAHNEVQIDDAEASSLAALDDTLEGDPTHAGEAAALATLAREPITRQARLLLDPESGRLFYRVESNALGVRQFHSVDAETGAVFDAVDALAHDHGRGVKGDRKSIVGKPGTADDLTVKRSEWLRMRSVDGRLITHDLGGRWGGSLSVARDGDNHWTGRGQRTAVDAQFYARTTDDFLRRRFGFDLLAPACGYGRINSVVRFGQRYANAFWNGRYLVYGDGDGLSFRALSGAQDVVAHELTHAVTQCTSDLVYSDEPGALNEAFSDIMATAAEFELAEPTVSNCRRGSDQAACPDWWIAEDVWLGASPQGIRSLADPAAGDQPAHYSSRYTGSADNGGVHINSGIPAHAFYLLAEGGRNARCSGPADPLADCDVTVPALGLAAASRIAFLAYATLPTTATFCHARQATIAAAETLHPGSLRHAAAAAMSWSAVGLDGSTCAPSATDFRVDLDRRSQYLAVGGAGELTIQLWRGTERGAVSLSVEGLPQAWYSLSSWSSTGAAGGEQATMRVTVPTGAPAGIYPVAVRATTASRSVRLWSVLSVDDTPPLVAMPQPTLTVGSVVPSSGGTLPLTVSWSAADAQSGIAEVRLQRSVDNGAWADVTTGLQQGRAIVHVAGGAHRFRIAAMNGVGMTATSAASPATTVTGLQEGAASYSAGWSAAPTAPAWGSGRYTNERDRTSVLRFSGGAVAWVAQQGPARGKARIYVDGVLAGRVDLYAASSAGRTVVFAAGGLDPRLSHSLRIVTLGTSGRPRVDVDGFLLLSR